MKTTAYTLAVSVKQELIIAVVADLHNHRQPKLTDALRREQPDMILIPGDLMNRLEDAENSIEFLKQARLIAPVFYSLGNHEFLDDKDKEQIASTGVVLLDNSSVLFNGVNIGGLSTDYRDGQTQGILPQSALDWLEGYSAQPDFKILLCHRPEYYPKYIKRTAIDLTVSGHAHGGQWRFFGRGIFAPGQGFFPEYTSGVYENRLVVSRGLANNTFIPRIFNEEELVIIRLLPNK